MGIYEYVSSIDGNTKVIYLATVIVITFSLGSLVAPLRLNVLVGLAIGLLVAYYMNDKAQTSTQNFETDLYYKLQTLGQVDSPTWSKSWPLGRTTTLPSVSFSSKYLYLDPDLIVLLDSIKNDLGASNLDNYVNMLRCVENVLHIRYDVVEAVTGGSVIEGAVENYQVAEDQMKAALNYGNGFSVSFLDASPVLYTKFEAFLKRFQLLLQRNLDLIKQRAQNGPLNCRTKFITDYNGPVAYNKAVGFQGTGDPQVDLATSHFNIY